MKFVITCGGTAGHINPGLAVADKIKKIHPESEFLFIGAEGHMEEDLIPRAGYMLKTVNISNISREMSLQGMVHNLVTAKNLVISLAESRKILKDFKPHMCIGTGGYVCYPVLKAAHDLGIKTLVHESNALPGLTTKMLADTADIICVGFEDSVQYYHHSERVHVTGTPVRGEFFTLTRDIARESLGIKKDERVVVSLWGSLGAGHMNNIVGEMLPNVCRDGEFTFIHATGKQYYPSFMDKINTTCPDYAGKNVRISDYIYNSPLWMNAADLVLCRAGASTLAELCYTGTPAIIVPSPNVTNNHQEHNARVLESAGGAIVMLENEFTSEQFYSTVKDTVCDSEKIKSMSSCMKKLSVDSAAEIICELILRNIKH